MPVIEIKYGQTQAEEYEFAEQQNRQPICVECKHKIEVVQQKQSEYIQWTWKKDKTEEMGGSYIKTSNDWFDGEVEKTIHVCKECEKLGKPCSAEDSDLVDDHLVSY